MRPHPPEHEHGETPDPVLLRREFRLLLERLQQLPMMERAQLQGRITQKLIDHTLAVDTPLGSLAFVMLGKIGAVRALHLLTKQPGTLEWIDSFKRDSIFWDVGANVGVYSLYAALRGDLRIVAFEPAAVNYFMLAAHCEANHFDDRIECLLMGLGDKCGIERLEVSQFASAQSFSFLGKPKKPRAGRQAAIVMSVDQLIENYRLQVPNYIKIDVPAWTEAVIAGATRTLGRPELRELHVEFVEGSQEGQWLVETLAGHGFSITNRYSHNRLGDDASADVTFARKGT